MKKGPETAASLRGILSQLRGSINACRDGATIDMPIGLARRIDKALEEYKEHVAALTEPLA
jgi:hypothetical protein